MKLPTVRESLPLAESSAGLLLLPCSPPLLRAEAREAPTAELLKARSPCRLRTTAALRAASLLLLLLCRRSARAGAAAATLPEALELEELEELEALEALAALALLPLSASMSSL